MCLIQERTHYTCIQRSCKNVLQNKAHCHAHKDEEINRIGVKTTAFMSIEGRNSSPEHVPPCIGSNRCYRLSFLFQKLKH